MWHPIIHDLDVLKERSELEKILEGDKTATISIEISVEAYLKIAEKSDCFSKNPEFMFCDRNAVGKFLSKSLLENFAKEVEKIEEGKIRAKRYAKSKTK